jgi:uncharacterized protein with PIN domain
MKKRINEDIKTNLDIKSNDVYTDKRFIVDSSLTKIAKHLRMLGIDCINNPEYSKNYLLYLAKKDDRIIITTNVKLVISFEKNKNLHKEKNKNKNNDNSNIIEGKNIIFETESEEIKNWKKMKKEEKKYNDLENFKNINEDDYEYEEAEDIEENINEDQYDYKYILLSSNKGFKEQIMLIVNLLKIEFDIDKLFSRCLNCNNNIQKVSKDEVKNKIYLNVYEFNENFTYCQTCDKVYWVNHFF